MKQTFFTPGPAQLYPTIVYHLKQAIQENILSISHRSERFQTIFKDTVDGLKMLLGIPKDYHIVFVASGTEAMERIIENTVEKNSFHFVNGSFSTRWFEIAKELKKNPVKYEVNFGDGFHKVPQIIKEVELICFTQNETSSGVATDPEFIYIVAKKNPRALIAVDTVSSAPYIDLDYTKLDCVFFSVQKLFGLPAGLGVIILSPRAIEKANKLQKKGINIGTYHNFPSLIAQANQNFTPDTPNVLDIYLLAKVVADLNKKGIKKIRKEIEEKADLVYSFFEKHPFHKPFVTNKKDRSQTVIAINVGAYAEDIKKKLKEKGIIIGGGYGPLKDTQVRIANLPAVTIQDIKKLLHII